MQESSAFTPPVNNQEVAKRVRKQKTSTQNNRQANKEKKKQKSKRSEEKMNFKQKYHSRHQETKIQNPLIILLTPELSLQLSSCTPETLIQYRNPTPFASSVSFCHKA